MDHFPVWVFSFSSFPRCRLAKDVNRAKTQSEEIMSTNHICVTTRLSECGDHPVHQMPVDIVSWKWWIVIWFLDVTSLNDRSLASLFPERARRVIRQIHIYREISLDAMKRGLVKKTWCLRGPGTTSSRFANLQMCVLDALHRSRRPCGWPLMQKMSCWTSFRSLSYTRQNENQTVITAVDTEDKCANAALI